MILRESHFVADVLNIGVSGFGYSVARYEIIERDCYYHLIDF